MTTTMNLIAKQTVGSGGAASVTFSNIPQTYTDLKVVASMRNNITGSGYVDVGIQFNGTASGYSYKTLYGNGSSASSFGGTSQTSIFDIWTNTNQNTASTFTSAEIYIPNYTSSNQKSVSMDGVSENNATTAYQTMSAGLSGITSAITSISVVPSSGSWVEFSTFYLYGISNSTTTQNTSVPYASGGDVITTDGSYWYHAFKYSGSFTPLKNLTADVLVIAGGGGGGGMQTGGGGGGGGAGGVCAQSARAITTGNYSVTIGAAGAGGIMDQGTNGGNSIFDTITAIGGGGGGIYSDPTAKGGKSGGSGGGGGGYQTSSSILGGSATQGNSGGATGYGFAGGNGVLNNSSTGGGGGSSAVGANGTGSAAGNGGAGKNTWSSWASATSTGVSGYYAGGGGGSVRADLVPTAGTGGAGGGGNGGANANGSNAIANTGSGGGGGGNAGTNTIGGNGGSGIIIVRYAV